MPYKSKIVLMVCLFLTVACAHDVSEKENPLTYCKEPRPQMCTMDYTPVCGLLDNKTVKTYGNACGACSDGKVSAYIANECQSDSLKKLTISTQVTDK